MALSSRCSSQEKPLREFAPGVNPAVLSDQNRVGRFVRFHTTNGNLMKDLAGDADISVVNEPARYTRDARASPTACCCCRCAITPAMRLGVIAAARDFSGTRAAASRSLIWQICLAIFAIVILSGVAIVVLRGFLLRPLEVLDARLAAMAAGKRTTALEATDKFCPEIQRLAERCERIGTAHSHDERRP